MNNNLEFENEDPSPDSIEDNHPRTNYGEDYYEKANFVTVNIESATDKDLGKVSYIPLPNVDYVPKQEKIEEAAAKHFNKEVFVEGVTIQYALQEAFITGAKY